VPTILALGLAAALYPQLLAVVVVILTRPSPRPLLWACYAGGASVSVGSGVAILLVFRDRGHVADSTSHTLGASVFLIVGVIAVLIATLVPAERARRVLGTYLPRVPGGGPNRLEAAGFVGQQKSRAQRALKQGSLPVAIVVGAVLGVPGPFDVLALGRISRGGYTVLTGILLIVAFNLIKFLLIEIPIVSYAVDPPGTAARVDRFSAWMKTNRLKLVALVVGVIGVALIAQGISRLG
jgi:hypothetical protein